VLFKPKGLVVHPGVGNRKDTLANYLKQYLMDKESLDSSMDRVGIVHRLDKGVSGVMVVAKNKHVQNKLKEQFAKRAVKKLYLAQVESFQPSELIFEKDYDIEEIIESMKGDNLNLDYWYKASGYIGRDRNNRFKMQFKLYEFGGSKKALSYILPISQDKMLIKIETGRMHQIRATLFYYGYHIVGDNLYAPGSRKVVSEDIMLQSIYLSFIHPISNERLHFVRI
jgi:23S rRNA pseudouridine1911/1915/1917 synthase